MVKRLEKNKVHRTEILDDDVWIEPFDPNGENEKQSSQATEEDNAAAALDGLHVSDDHDLAESEQGFRFDANSSESKNRQSSQGDDKFHAPVPPSKVIHIRGLPISGVSKTELEGLIGQVSPIIKLIMFKSQALLEMECIAEATKVVEHYESSPAILNGYEIHLNYSRSQELNDKSSVGNYPSKGKRPRSPAISSQVVIPRRSHSAHSMGPNMGSGGMDMGTGSMYMDPRRPYSRAQDGFSGRFDGPHITRAVTHDQQMLLDIAMVYLQQYNIPYTPGVLNIAYRENLMVEDSNYHDGTRGRRR